MSKQLPYGGLVHKILAWSRRNHVSSRQVQKMVAVYVAERLLPVGTIVKGGNSFLLRFPLHQTRYSQDLDLMVSTSYHQWEQEYRNQLHQGWMGFSGRLSIRGVEEHGRKRFGTPGFVMYPRDAHISYLGRPFAKLPLDITPQLDNLKPVEEALSEDVRNLIHYLGFPVQDHALFANPIEQMIDKAATIYYSEPPRSYDLVDLDLLCPELKSGGLLPQAVTDGVIRDVRSRGGRLLMTRERVHEITHHFVDHNFGSASQAQAMVESINGSVQSRLKNI